jgi:hypothetical protein
LNLRRTCSAVVVAAALVGASVCALASAQAGAATQHVLAGGAVVDAEGRPVTDAVVEAYAWPSNDELAAMTPGTHFDLAPVARGHADSSGSYALARDEKTIGRFKDKHGNVNLEIVIRSRGGVATTSTGVAGDGSTATTTRHAPAQIDRAMLQHATATTSTVAAGPIPCGVIYKGDLGDHLVWVGGHYSTTTGVTHDLVYSNGASSSLGVGVSTSGRFGTFSASGTTSVSSTGTINFPTTTGRQHDYTYFNYDKYLVGCAGTMKYEARATGWVGGAHVWVPPTAPTANYCYSYAAGSSFTRDRTVAYDFSTGADVSSAIGIDLSARTGYSSSAKVTFHFAATRHLCGTSGPPGGVPGRLVAKP